MYKVGDKVKVRNTGNTSDIAGQIATVYRITGDYLLVTLDASGNRDTLHITEATPCTISQEEILNEYSID